MKIVFLCGCLEPGRDGVGDYTRRLAGEVIRQGHQAAIIALNDPHIGGDIVPIKSLDKKPAKESQDSDGTNVPVLRLSRNAKWSARIKTAKFYINLHNPEFLSLQFVPYSFHWKGMPRQLPSSLSTLGYGRRWHIMFHELWIGITKSSPVTHKITGFIQRRIVKQLVKQLQPSLINCSNGLYQEMLQRNNITPIRLPIFSNIPIVNECAEWFYQAMNKHGIDIHNRRNDWLMAGIFGSAHFSVDMRQAIGQLESEARKINKRLCIVLVGVPSNSPSWLKEMKNSSAATKIVHLGLRTQAEISTFLKSLDIGLIPTPCQMIGKSGAAAAMHEHGVEIRNLADTKLPEFDACLPKNENLNSIFQSLPSVANKLIKCLNNN